MGSQTIRVIVANADALAKRKDAIGRFMQAYRETIAYMYSSNPQVIEDYADFVGVSNAVDIVYATLATARGHALAGARPSCCSTAWTIARR